MNKQYQKLTEIEKTQLRSIFNEEPIYNNLRCRLSSFYEHSGILQPEEIWYESKRLCLKLVRSNSPVTTLCEYVEDMRNELQSVQIENRVLELHGEHISKNMHQAKIDDVINHIILYTWVIIYVMEDDSYTGEYMWWDKVRGDGKDALKAISEYSDDWLSRYINSIKIDIDRQLKDKSLVNEWNYYDVSSDEEDLLNKSRGDELVCVYDINHNYHRSLEEAKEDPVKRSCYKGVLRTLSRFALQNNIEITEKEYDNIFIEAELFLFDIEKSEFKEIAILNSQNRIRKKFNTIKTNTNNDDILCKSPNFIKGILIEAIFIIVAYEKFKDAIDVENDTFIHCRTNFEDSGFDKLIDNSVWKLICERIPRMEKPCREDLEAEIERLRNKLSIYEELKEPQINLKPLVIDPHDKVRLEVMMKLLESSNVDLKTRGNKAETARLLECLTGLPLSTCRNYVTNRDLNKDTHKEEITTINSQLEKIKISWRI